MKFKNKNFLSQTGTSWHPYEAHMGTPGEFSTKSQQLFLFSLHPFCLHPYAKHICCLSSAFFLSSSFKPPLLFLLFSSTLYLCCTFQTFPPSHIFSIFSHFPLFFLPIFNCSFVSFSFYSPNRTVPYIFQQSLCKLSGWEQGVSRAVKGPCTPDPHIYRLIHTTHATHTHTHTSVLYLSGFSAVSAATHSEYLRLLGSLYSPLLLQK